MPLLSLFSEHVEELCLAFLASFILCGTLVATRHLHLHKTTRNEDLSAVQAMHAIPVPRVAGLCIFAAIILTAAMLIPDAERDLTLLLLMSAAPTFFAGLLEDLGWRVSVRGRLVSAAASALLAIILLEVWIPTFHLPGLALITSIAPFAIGLTVLWSAGVCHAFNLIDGTNGLCGTISAMVAVALAMIAMASGVDHLAPLAAITAAALLGFLVLNWPAGLIFMGDAGAYAIGHILVWIAILLAWQDPSISPIALSLLFFWPVADTFLAMWRRLARGTSIGQPDKLHFHQLVMRAILISIPGMPLRRANAMTALCVIPFASMPIISGITLVREPGMALLAWAFFGVLFISTYLSGMRFFRRQAHRGRNVSRCASAAGHAAVPVPERDHAEGTTQSGFQLQVPDTADAAQDR